MGIRDKYDIDVNLRGKTNRISPMLNNKKKIDVDHISFFEGKAPFINHNETMFNPFTVEFIPSNATNKKIIWESDNLAITFNEDGSELTCGPTPGGFDVIITARAEDNLYRYATTTLMVNAVT